MTGKRALTRLIDTSAWIEALRRAGDPETAAAVAEALEQGVAVTCPMVLLELWNGTGSDRDRKAVKRIEETLEVLAIDSVTWQEAAALARRCRAAGQTIPATDLLIAACAEQHGALVLHREGHVDTIARLAK